MGSNLKGIPSDLDDRRRLDSTWDQREDNVTAAGTTDRCAGASSLQVPVMAAPNVLESLQEVIKQGSILHNLSDKGKATDAAVQKALSKFMPGLTAIVQQLELINKHKNS